MAPAANPQAANRRAESTANAPTLAATNYLKAKIDDAHNTSTSEELSREFCFRGKNC